MTTAPLDIAIAGCGISGLASAILLGRAGHRITIYDRFAAPRPVGSGLMLQPTGLAVLAHMGLRDAVEARGARIARILGRRRQDDRIVLDVRYDALGPKGKYGVAVHRAALFDQLFAAASALADIESVREITGVTPFAGGRQLEFAGGGISARHDLVIDALGAFSLLRPHAPEPLTFGALWATLPWNEAEGFAIDRLEQRYLHADKMVGVLPIGTASAGAAPSATFFWSLRGADLAAWQRGDLAAWRAEVAALWPRAAAMVARLESHDQLTFARYAHATTWNPASAGLLHIGDAYHATSPQLGQGANFALIDAATLAHVIAQADDLPSALGAFVAARRWHIGLYQTLSHVFTPAYQSEKRWPAVMRDEVLAHLLNIWPAQPVLASLVAGSLMGPLKRAGLR